MILTHFAALIFPTVAPDASLAPVSLAEAKAHLRILDTDDDAYISRLINAAAQKITKDTGIVSRAQNISLTRDGFADNGQARVPLTFGPVNSIGSITYDAADGTEQTLAAGQYRLRDFAGMAHLVPAFGVTWPATENIIGAVRVTFNAGYASNADVPETIRHAALLLIGHWFENREAVVIGQTPNEVPAAYEALIAAHRLRWTA